MKNNETEPALAGSPEDRRKFVIEAYAETNDTIPETITEWLQSCKQTQIDEIYTRIKNGNLIPRPLSQ